MDPGGTFRALDVLELIRLCLLALFGFGLALAQDDLLFAGVFGAVCATITIEVVRRSR